MLENIVEQYDDNNYSLYCYSDWTDFDTKPLNMENLDEIFIATKGNSECKESEDLKNLKCIADTCSRFKSDKKIKIHLLLHSSDTLMIFQRKELCMNLKEIAEIHPFTIESLWAQNIFVTLPTNKTFYPPLDREYLGIESNKYVHVVIFNMNSMSETLSEYIALTSHYANYTKNHSLRTRITIVDNDVIIKKKRFLNKNQALFENSYFRVVNLDNTDSNAVVELHKPKYYKNREDFVDIEWEFVKADINNKILRDKLSLWAKSDEQILTLFLCSETEGNNIKDVMILPIEVEDNRIPVFVRCTTANITDIFNMQNNVFGFGMLNCFYDIKLPLIKLAKMVNYVYDSCYNDNYVNESRFDNIYSPISIDIEEAEVLWNKLSSAKKWSNIYNAMTISSKMRALGYSSEDWISYNGMSCKEISLIAEMEHNRWNVEELILGFYPVNEGQEKEIEIDIRKKKYYKEKFFHYDLRAYNDLRPDESGKNVSTYDICLSNSITLLANTFLTNMSDE